MPYTTLAPAASTLPLVASAAATSASLAIAAAATLTTLAAIPAPSSLPRPLETVGKRKRSSKRLKSARFELSDCSFGWSLRRGYCYWYCY